MGAGGKIWIDVHHILQPLKQWLAELLPFIVGIRLVFKLDSKLYSSLPRAPNLVDLE